MKEKYDHRLLLKHLPSDLRVFLEHIQVYMIEKYSAHIHIYNVRINFFPHFLSQIFRFFYMINFIFTIMKYL